MMVHEPSKHLAFEGMKMENGRYNHYNPRSKFVRPATEDEIELARVQAWKEGEPYLVNIYGETDAYLLLYSAKKYQQFYRNSCKSGHFTSTPSYIKLETDTKLPVNQ